MASFNDILKTHAVINSGHNCLTGKWRNTLTPDDQAQFDAACADDTVAAVSIYRTIKAMGFPGGDSAFLRHRNRGCRCELR